MRNLHSRLRRTHLFIILIIVIALGIIYFSWGHKSSSNTEARRYVSLGDNYIFTVPANYTANGTALSGATLVYPDKSPPQNGQSLNDLYPNGTIALQAITELKDNNSEAFTNYVKNVLAPDLGKAFKSPTDLRPAKQEGVMANELSAVGAGGKLLQVIYAVDFTQPVLAAAQDRSEAFKTVSSTMGDLKKSSLKPEIDQAAQEAKVVAQQLQKQASADLRKNASSGFKKKTSEAQLADSLNKSSQYLQRPISIVGGLYNGEFFIAQLVFEAKAVGEQPTPAVISLHKEGKTWKLDDLQLPK